MYFELYYCVKILSMNLVYNFGLVSTKVQSANSYEIFHKKVYNILVIYTMLYLIFVRSACYIDS